MRRFSLALFALTLASCGGDNSVPPRDDAAVVNDGAASDAAMSDGAASDGAVIDATIGIDSGGNPGACSPACDGTQFCELPLCTATTGGACVLRPNGLCPAIAMPQCGCDGKTYGNECERRSAGVSKLKDGPCECALNPPLTCCFDDGDCRNNQRCANSTCSQGGAGSCVAPPAMGTCWLDRDCPAPMVCKGASICGCLAACLLPDRPGTCGNP